MPRRSASTSLTGFTLVELLVVVAVIGLLIAIILPAISRAREAGRATTCLSTLRQIGIAGSMYEALYEGFIPREGSPGSPEPPARSELIPWNVAFRPFLDDRCSPGSELNDMFEGAPYYRCASRPAPGKTGGHRVHYVMNAFAFVGAGQPDERGATDPQFLRGPMQSRLIRSPARMLYLMDFAADPGDVLYSRWTGGGTGDIWIGQFYDAWLTKHLTETSDDFRIGPKAHGGGASALYLDGHALHQESQYFQDVSNWDDGYHTKL